MSTYETDLAQAVWRKASYSNGNGGNCVEVADIGGEYQAVRDSKDPAGPVLMVSRREWSAFTIGLRADEFC